MNEDMIYIARRIFDMGGPEGRDALRAIANKVLSPKAAFNYEVCEPDLETTYRLLEELKFTGDGTMLLPGDEITAIDNLLNKKWAKTFMSAVSNMALTMHCTNPRTAGKGYWPKSHSDCCELLSQAFAWTCSQHGLENILKDSACVSHTRLPQFIIALQVVGKDEGHARHWSLFDPIENSGGVTTNNVIPPEYLNQLALQAQANRPPEYGSVATMDFQTLAELLEKQKLLAVDGEPVGDFCTCGCDDEDDCECDEPATRNDYNKVSELRSVYYDKYGWPDDKDGPEIDEDIWLDGVSLMEVSVHIPTVRLPMPEANDYLTAPRRGQPKTKQRAVKHASTRLTLTRQQQIWHEVDSHKEFGDRRFAITLVSRHTCGVNRAVATDREALAIAGVIMDAISK